MTLLHYLAAAVCLALGFLLAGVGFLCWIARGEPDVNGEPERDAGKAEGKRHKAKVYETEP